MMIIIENLTKYIKKRLILDHINLSLEGGYIYGFRGINGSGKTMLMRAICGMIHPTSGSISVDGKRIHSGQAYPVPIGALIENPSFLRECTGYENLKLLADLRGFSEENEVIKSIQMLGLDPKDKRLYREYSLGMRQRLGIAAAIMGSPELIVLDEPINALDENGVKTVRDILFNLKSSERIIIIACHDREEMNYLADRIYILEEGRIIGEENGEKKMVHVSI